MHLLLAHLLGLSRRAQAAAGLVLAVVWATPIAAQDVRYTLSPRVEQIHWDDDLAFDRIMMAGLAAVVDFGAWVSLEARAAAGRDLNARFSESGMMDTLGNAAADAFLEISRFGLALRVNGGTSRVVPFARAGGDVLRFDSPDGRVVRTVALHYGGGVRATLGSRWRAELFAEDLRLRVNRARLAPGVAPGADPDAAVARRNLTLGASLGYAFGGPSADAEDARFRLVSVPVEAFGGRLRLADAAIPEVTVAGARLGVDVGQNVGVQAFHLRPVGPHPGVDGTLSSTGVEMKFNLNALPRFAPYLIVGGGQMTFSEDFRDQNGQPRSDYGVLILGGGIGFRLSDQFRINASIRDLMHSGDDPLNAVGSTSELRHAVLLTAGVAFNIGRSRRGGLAVVRDSAPPSRERQARDSSRVARVDTVAGARDSMPTAPTAVRDHQSDRFVTIPLPKEGEFYVRYGPVDTTRLRSVRPGESQADTLRIQELVRREVERLLAARAGAGTAAAPAPVIVQPPQVIAPRGTPSETPAPTRTSSQDDTGTVQRLSAELDRALAQVTRMRERLAALEAAGAEPPAVAPPDTIEVPRRAENPEGPDLAIRRETLARLRAAKPGDVQVSEHARGLVVTLGGSLFSSEEATFDASGRAVVGLVAALIEAYPDVSVAIEGHTDALGDERYNQLLSEQRAEFVRNALVRAGTAPRRVSASGFGPHHPIADNATAAGRAKNRRVEVVLVGAVNSPPATP